MISRLLKAAAVLVAAGTLAACEHFEIPQIDPPHLQLEAPPIPSNLPRGDYTLTNGEGETLMEVRQVAPEQEHNADIPLDKLDGTINIVATKDGQQIYTQTVTHTPGTRVKLEWDIHLSRFLAIENYTPEPTGSRRLSSGDGGGDH